MNYESKVTVDAQLRAPSTAEQLQELLTPLDVLRGLPRLMRYKQWPKGQGEHVIVLPGFGGADNSTWALRRTLNLAGYKAHGWDLGLNNGDVPRLMQAMLTQVERAYEKNGQPVHLVGWSLGGYLAREVARDLPDAVAGVVTLGSPVVGGAKYTAVSQYWRTSPEALDRIENTINERYHVPIRCPVVSLYSKRDGIVAWQASIDNRSPQVQHKQVQCSHLALGFSVPVLEAVLNAMADNIEVQHNLI